MSAGEGRRQSAPPDLWDPLVRISHWAIAAVVILNALITRGGSAVHVAVGWIGLALLLLRLVWGLVGPAEARFTAFPPNPRAARGHLAEQEAAVASGDWSVMVVQDGSTGGTEGKGEDRMIKQVHGVAANLMLALAFLHVAGVAIESRAMGRNLVTPMIAGRIARPRRRR
jgi:cytochrome b